MADANKAVLISCSSDWWMDGAGGGRPESTDLKWKFRGQNLVEAYI